MAEALMVQRLSELRASAGVASAGLLEGGRLSPPEVIELMALIGVDLSHRTSREVSVEDIDRSDLVLTMERFQLREVSVLTPPAWAKTFTLKEFIGRCTSVGGRREGESVESWIARVHEGRQVADLLGESSIDEVADPYGGTPDQYASTELELEGLVAQLADLICGPPAEAASEPPARIDGVVASPDRGGRSRLGLARRG
jgi:protein-tyrosine-phosphatase